MRSSLSVVAVLLISFSIPLVAQGKLELHWSSCTISLLTPKNCHLFLSTPEILHAPESSTVFLNKPAVFTCETRGGTTLWRVNGTQRETFSPDIRSDLVVSEITNPEGTTVETLTIPARAQYNGTKVQCLSVIIDVSRVESDNATLTIQGFS